MGLVNTAFPPEALLKLRYGNLGICHTRYSTTGISELQNCQPFVVDTLHGKIAVAHNGELVNALALRKKVNMAFCSFRSINLVTIMLMCVITFIIRYKQTYTRKLIHKINLYCVFIVRQSL